jgi:hypothetical protein
MPSAAKLDFGHTKSGASLELKEELKCPIRDKLTGGEVALD